ncbi:hypothetical protein [Sporomusa malonica]|uniref:Uncharacterized protein n=1 Tax=Sporomusa malonica TaxID=112901 RepID=A0A1W2EH53_9FIRM|nr:hypothetical protein [Sporomusa malonica]SMD09060.1 hypothetical protein SAMN04488500_12437 [Sporomusa malonica]
MAKKQERCDKGCKSGKASVEFGKEICPNAKNEKKDEKSCK